MFCIIEMTKMSHLICSVSVWLMVRVLMQCQCLVDGAGSGQCLVDGTGSGQCSVDGTGSGQCLVDGTCSDAVLVFG